MLLIPATLHLMTADAARDLFAQQEVAHNATHRLREIIASDASKEEARKSDD